MVGGVEKWEDRILGENEKYLVFPRVCLVGGVEKWEDGKLFCLVEKKSGRIKKFSFPLCVFGWRDRKVGRWKILLFG